MNIGFTNYGYCVRLSCSVLSGTAGEGYLWYSHDNLRPNYSLS